MKKVFSLSPESVVFPEEVPSEYRIYSEEKEIYGINECSLFPTSFLPIFSLFPHCAI